MTREFTFELRVCQWAERHWPPSGTLRDDTAVVVARQLGTRHRRWDTVVLECDADALADRARFGDDRLDSDLLHVVRHAPADYAYYRDALPHPGYPWRYVREAIHAAADRGCVETRRNGNRIELRRKWAYPDWVRRVVAIENKPDLDASAADALADQLTKDVALGLADEVWVATRATGDRVEPALLERLPVQAGILTVADPAGGETGDPTAVDADDPTAVDAGDPAAVDAGDPAAVDASDRAFDRGEVVWHPRTLDVDATGTRVTDTSPGGTYDQSAWRFEYVDPAWKHDKRLEIAERAYERGWRSYADTMRPDCRHFGLRRVDGAILPWCAAKERSPVDRECAGSCPSFSPEPPAWRSKGWPIEGGPGKAIKRLLDDRRRRQRPGSHPTRE